MEGRCTRGGRWPQRRGAPAGGWVLKHSGGLGECLGPAGASRGAPRRMRNGPGSLFQEAPQEALATVPVPADTWGLAGPSDTYWLRVPELHCLPATQRWSSRGEEALWCTNGICLLLCSFSALSTRQALADLSPRDAMVATPLALGDGGRADRGACPGAAPRAGQSRPTPRLGLCCLPGPVQGAGDQWPQAPCSWSSWPGGEQ